MRVSEVRQDVPLYEYECGQCGRFELIKKFSDPVLSACPTCGREVQKLFSAPAVHFKGTGWYVTDYAGKGKDKDKDKEKEKEKEKEKGKEGDAAKAVSGDSAAKSSADASKSSDGKANESSTPKAATSDKGSASGSSSSQ